MNNGKVAWRGSFPAVVTPFRKDGSIDERLFAANLELLMEEGAAGLVVCGSTGEAWSMTVEEKVRLAGLAASVAARSVPVIVGTGEIRTDRVIEASLGVKAAGADGVMVVPPYYAEVNRDAVLQHYRTIDKAVGLPIVLYNHPQTTGVNLDASYLEELAELEWVVATKESANDVGQLFELLFKLGDRLDIMAGYTAKHGAAGAFMGCSAFVGATETQILGAEGISLFRVAAEGDVARARQIQRRANALGAIGAIGATPAGLKAGMNLLGRPGGYCRTPIPDLTSEEIEHVERILDSLDLFNSPACQRR